MTITDMAGRNLSGHTVEAFWAAIRHVKPLTIGLMLVGADLLRPASGGVVKASRCAGHGLSQRRPSQ